MKKDLLKGLELSEKNAEERNEQATSFPLSYNQRDLFVLYQRYPDNPFYNLTQFCLFQNGLVLESLIKSFRSVVKQHDILRTKFLIENGEAMQVVEPFCEPDFRIHHLESEAEYLRKSNDIVREDARIPFDLKQSCAVRISIIVHNNHVFAFGLTVHHIVMDIWSIRLFMDEVAENYNNQVAGIAFVLKELPLNYGIYAKQQREKSLNLDNLSYWKDKLQNMDALGGLPYDFVRPAVQNFSGAQFKFRLPIELCQTINSITKETGVTPFVFHFAIFNLLLYKYSGSNSISVGVPFSNRLSTELEKVIGFFDETKVLNTHVGGVDFISFLEDVSKNVREVFEHMDAPLEEIIKAINPSRQNGINPLFQTMFIYNRSAEVAVFGEEESYLNEILDIGISKFDLSLFVGEDEEGYYMIFEYSTELFKESTINSMADHFKTLLHQIIENPKISISKLQLLNKFDLEKITNKWNDNDFDIGKNENIIDLIEKQCEDHFEAIAVADGIDQISYGSLNERANKIAGFLASKGIQNSDIVALHFDRSINMIVSILGVLKSGAAYLPLDPEYPIKRIELMIEDSNAKIVISDQTSQIQGKPIVFSYENILDESIETNTITPRRIDDLAYIIYTSGSTGKPKGVEITHANLLNSTLARNHYYPSVPNSFLLLSSFSFDSSIAGIFWTLTSGAKLVIAGKHMEQDLQNLSDEICRHEISHTLLLPTLYKEILLSGNLEKLKGLKSVIVAGEAFDQSLIKLHFEKLKDTKLYNEYGPTEATVWATVEEIDQYELNHKLIGKPVGNTRVYILNDQLQPVPPGIEGEIYIGGNNVAKGYRNNSVATTEKFVRNPFAKEVEKLYKTGDLGKFRNDGKIEFIGRVDGQVKLLGHRIELQEIENNVNAIEGVKESAVILRSNKKSAGQIICYYSISDNINEEAIKKQLQNELPNFMIPSRFIKLESLPKLPNGKVDKNKLPLIKENGLNTVRQLPRNEIESKLHKIWVEILIVKELGIEDNFFELGGDSILSIRLISQARNVGIRIKPNEIFKYQSIAELAKHLTEATKNKSELTKRFIGRSILSPYQTRILKNDSIFQGVLFNIYEIKLKESINKAILTGVIEIIIRHCDALHLIFELSESKATAIFKDFSMSDFKEEISKSNKTSALELIVGKMKKSKSPLFKFVLIENENSGAEINSIVVVAHRLSMDFLSIQLIANELASIASELLKQDEPNNSLHGVNFATWLDLIHSEAATTLFKQQQSFWQSEAGGYRHGRTTAATKSQLMHRKTLEIEADISKLLFSKALSGYNLRAFELMMVTYLYSVKNLVNSDLICVWPELDGRKFGMNELDFSKSIGCFNSIFPVSFSVDDDLKTTLINTKEKLRSIPTSGVGYDYLTQFSDHHGMDQDTKYGFVYNELNDTYYHHIIDKINVLKSDQINSDFDITVNCTNISGELRFEFSAASQIIDEKELADFIVNFKSHLIRIIEHCADVEQQFTPSDFPDANLTDDDLNALFS